MSVQYWNMTRRTEGNMQQTGKHNHLRDSLVYDGGTAEEAACTGCPDLHSMF